MTDFFTHLEHQLITLLGHNHYLSIGALVMARLVILVTMTPFLGGKNVPSMVKIGLSFTLLLILWPHILQSVPQDLNIGSLTFIALVAKEAFIGLALALIISEIFYLVETAGMLMDAMRFASMTQGIIPENSSKSTALGALNFQLMIAIFLATGMHHYFFQGLVDSYNAVPVLEFPKFTGGLWAFTDQFLHLVARVFHVAFTLAFPVAILSLTIDTCFGLMNRVAPQINAFFMSLPAKTLGGLTIFYFAFNMALEQYKEHAANTIGTFFNLIDLFR